MQNKNDYFPNVSKSINENGAYGTPVVGQSVSSADNEQARQIALQRLAEMAAMYGRKR